MKKSLYFLLLCLIPFTNFAQATHLEDLCQVFHLPDGKDTTTFIVYGTKADLQIKKPLFFFRQGSRPYPLMENYQGRFYLFSPFRFEPYKNDYHFVMVQKSGTLLVADSTYMQGFDKAMQTADSKYLTKKYLENNNLDKATRQCNQVINYLIKQPWIDAKKVVFCGGSEGFTVGANLVANVNKSITHTVLFSGHAGRRFESNIYQVRKAVQQGQLTPEEGQKEVEELYKLWADIQANPKSIDKSYGDNYYTWSSFSKKNSDNLLKINVPLYIAYGTEDNEIAPSLDYLPLDFIEVGKKNLTLRTYIGHDHQFNLLKKDNTGKVIDRQYRGDEVAKDWMDWLKGK
jgi:dienelactone hydrolase